MINILDEVVGPEVIPQYTTGIGLLGLVLIIVVILLLIAALVTAIVLITKKRRK